MTRISLCVEGGQLAVAVAQLFLLGQLLRTIWRSQKHLPRNVRAPFAIRGQSIVAASGAIVGFWFFWSFLDPLTSVVWLWFSAAMVPITAISVAYSMSKFRKLATNALRQARHADEFDRIWVFKNYARIFRPRVEPLLSMINDRSAQRALLTLCDEGYEVRGRPLRNLVEERVRRLEGDALAHALNLGFCADDKELQDTVQQRAHAQREAVWGQILSRHPCAPTVGIAMRAIIEESLARHDPRWVVRVQGRFSHASAKQALRRLGNKLGKISEEVKLDLVFELDGPDSTNATMQRIAQAKTLGGSYSADPIFCLELSIQDTEMDSIWCRERVRATPRRHARYGEDPEANTVTTELRDVEIFYPNLTITGRMLRDGLAEHTITVSSVAGRQDFSKGDTWQQEQLCERAASLLFDGLLKGVGLQVST